MELSGLMNEAEADRQLADLASTFGLTRHQTEAVVDSILPEITRHLERQSLSRGGVADVISMLGEAGTTPLEFGREKGLERGNALLEQVFGTRDTSRAVAARASRTSGIAQPIIKAMLPHIIQMAMRAFSRRASGGLGDILSKIPDIGATAPAPAGRRGGSAFPAPSGASPLPGPEDMDLPRRNPYGDLSDIVRRGGSGSAVGGNPLWRVIRNVLGTALGFQSRGVVSWILRYVVVRFGSKILRTVLRRAFGSR